MVRKIADNPTIDEVASTLLPRTRANRQALIDNMTKPLKPGKFKKPKPIPPRPKAGRRRHRILDIVSKQAIVVMRFGSLLRG